MLKSFFMVAISSQGNSNFIIACVLCFLIISISLISEYYNAKDIP